VLVACFWMPQFVIAVERARLTHLWGRPLALARDGILAAVSEEALPYGVRPGLAAAGARALCQDLAILPYDDEACREAARPVWDLFAIESSVVEPESPETCFVEFSGADVLPRVRQLASDVASRVRIPVHAGLARTKFVARHAAMGPAGGQVVTVPAGREAAFAALLPLECAEFLDLRVRQRLQRLGVRRLGDVARLPARDLHRQFREVGELLRRLALGEDGERVRPLWPPRSLEQGLFFEDEVADEARLHEGLRRCAEALGSQLARSREYARSVALMAVLAGGEAREESEKLLQPAESARPIFRAALRLLGRMRLDRPVVEVRLRAGDLGTGSGVQLALLDDSRMAGLPHERQRSLEAALAFLRRRCGPGAVVTAGRMRQAGRTELWTYPLGRRADEPLEVVTDQRGAPLRFHSRGRTRWVRQIQDVWRETEWFWDSLVEQTVYRVETDSGGLCEIRRCGVQWRLQALAD